MDLIKVTLHGIGMGKHVQAVDQQLKGQNVVQKMSPVMMWTTQLKWLKLLMMIFQADLEIFTKILNDAEKPLYPGCRKFTKLSALVKLYNLKARYGWSDKGFSELLGLLGEMLPLNNELPLSMYKAKKTLNALGMEYEKIHACPNDCILYRNELKNASSCPTCGASRWKVNSTRTRKRKGVPAKVMWYFPPIPRFKRMFHSSKIEKYLT